MSRSGPNIKPPNSIAPVAKNASESFPVRLHAATKVGAASMIVIASCVFPEGINLNPSDVCARDQLPVSLAFEIEVRVPTFTSFSWHVLSPFGDRSPFRAATISRLTAFHPILNFTPREANTSRRQLLKRNLLFMNPVAYSLRRGLNPLGKLIR